MVVISDTVQPSKIDKKRIQNANTNIKLLYYDEEKNISTLQIIISK
jgi:hypothetical protein